MRALALYLVVLASAAAGQGYQVREGHGGPIMDVSVDAAGQIATASFDNSVGLWDEANPIWHEGHLAAVNRVIFLPDGRLASGGDDFAIHLWKGVTSERLVGHQGKVMGLAVSPDGATLASASWDGSVGLWPLSGGAPTFLHDHESSVTDVAYGTDGRLYSASADGTIRLWTAGRSRVLVQHGFGVNRLQIGPDWLAYGAVDGGTRLVDPDTGALLADFTAGRRPILALSYADGRLAVGDGEGYIMVVDVGQGRVLHDFRAVKRGPVWALAWSPSGHMLHAGGLDPVLVSWPLDVIDGADPAGSATQTFLSDPKEMSNGERQFQRKCSICHTLTPGSARRAGPSLHNLFGRPAGQVVDYRYSQTLQKSDIIWNEQSIDALFDEGPDQYIPGSKMPMQRIVAPNDRADLIAFLKDATRTGE